MFEKCPGEKHKVWQKGIKRSEETGLKEEWGNGIKKRSNEIGLKEE